MICSLRTNMCLFLALFLLVITFGLFSGTFFTLALGNLELAAKLQKVRHGSIINFQSVLTLLIIDGWSM
jgi:hypothetical protein